MMKDEEKRIVTVDELPDDPLKMPPPYWRGGGAIFHLEYALWALEDLLQQLLSVHAPTDAKLDEYYEKYPENDQSDAAMDEFAEITEELSELEHRIRMKGELACLMSAIEAEGDINRFCVFNLHKDISESIEKLSPPEKLLVAAAAVGKPGAKQTSVFEGLRLLFSWRNAFAHGHCVDRPTKSLRHNHLIPPDDYPGVPSVLAEMRELVGAFLRTSDYLRKISLNPYTKSKEGDVEIVRETLQKIACYRFDGNNWVYDVMVTGSEQEKIIKALNAIVVSGDLEKKAKLESVLATLDHTRSQILRMEFGVDGTSRCDRKEIMKALKLSAKRFGKERSLALTRLAGAADLIAEGTV